MNAILTQLFDNLGPGEELTFRKGPHNSLRVERIHRPVVVGQGTYAIEHLFSKDIIAALRDENAQVDVIAHRIERMAVELRGH